MVPHASVAPSENPRRRETRGPGMSAPPTDGDTAEEASVSESAEKRYRVFVPFTDEQMAELESAHGRISPRVLPALDPPRTWVPNDVPEPHWCAVFREPTTGEVEFFERHAHGTSKDAALRNLAKATIVAVSFQGKHTVCLDRNDRASVDAVRAAWDQGIRKRFGGAHLAAQDDLMLLAGMSRDETGKE